MPAGAPGERLYYRASVGSFGNMRFSSRCHGIGTFFGNARPCPVSSAKDGALEMVTAEGEPPAWCGRTTCRTGLRLPRPSVGGDHRLPHLTAWLMRWATRLVGWCAFWASVRCRRGCTGMVIGSECAWYLDKRTWMVIGWWVAWSGRGVLVFSCQWSVWCRA